MAYGRSTSPSIFDGFTLSPLPYPVLLILAVISIFLFMSNYFTYESVVEQVEEQMNWMLFATPVVLILLVKWLSTVDPSCFSFSPYDRRRMAQYYPSDGSSPWGVAALILLLLVMVQYQSSFLDRWFG